MESMDWRHVAASLCCGIAVGVSLSRMWMQQREAGAAITYKQARGKREMKPTSDVSTTITFLGTGSSTGEVLLCKPQFNYPLHEALYLIHFYSC